METEKWMCVAGYIGLYEVSNLGNIRPVYREYTCSRGKRRSVKVKNLLLNSRRSRSGYTCVGLMKGLKEKKINLHILVGKAFVPNPNRKPFLNHIDGDKTNARASNLEWATTKENNDHAIQIGLKQIRKGEDVPSASISSETAMAIYNSVGRHFLLAKSFGVSPSIVKNIKNGITWVSVTGHEKRGRKCKVIYKEKYNQFTR